MRELGNPQGACYVISCMYPERAHVLHKEIDTTMLFFSRLHEN